MKHGFTFRKASVVDESTGYIQSGPQAQEVAKQKPTVRYMDALAYLLQPPGAICFAHCFLKDAQGNYKLIFAINSPKNIPDEERFNKILASTTQKVLEYLTKIIKYIEIREKAYQLNKNITHDNSKPNLSAIENFIRKQDDVICFFERQIQSNQKSEYCKEEIMDWLEKLAMSFLGEHHEDGGLQSYEKRNFPNDLYQQLKLFQIANIVNVTEIAQGNDIVHAETAVASYVYNEFCKKQVLETHVIIGISKLCCLDCAITLNEVNSAIQRTLNTSLQQGPKLVFMGSHGLIFNGWRVASGLNECLSHKKPSTKVIQQPTHTEPDKDKDKDKDKIRMQLTPEKNNPKNLRVILSSMERRLSISGGQPGLDAIETDPPAKELERGLIFFEMDDVGPSSPTQVEAFLKLHERSSPSNVEKYEKKSSGFLKANAGA